MIELVLSSEKIMVSTSYGNPLIGSLQAISHFM